MRFKEVSLNNVKIQQLKGDRFFADSSIFFDVAGTGIALRQFEARNITLFGERNANLVIDAYDKLMLSDVTVTRRVSLSFQNVTSGYISGKIHDAYLGIVYYVCSLLTIL